jgi:hypothetical protein
VVPDSPVRWLARWLRKIFRTAFGQLSYRPPYWLQRGFARTVLFRRGHPVLAAVIVLGAFLIAGASVWTWRWYQALPKPHKVYATVAPIPVTPLAKELKLPPLTIEFSESAARLEDLKNPTLQHVRLDPPTAGAWKWIDDRKLSFVPAQDWPADKQFRVIFDREFFPSHVRMEKLEYDASTPPFRADLKDVTLSEDAKEPGVQRVVATIDLTHSVEPGRSKSFWRSTCRVAGPFSRPTIQRRISRSPSANTIGELSFAPRRSCCRPRKTG